ncbi:hypothetical protein MNBD_GAMMA12-3558 [hydrothermal vent metagenome]|uniref:SxtJ n=1 Tax=hydrothermal vent metagenome TaxID=652676 RepID=A0A3B0Y7N1_9ZZZZ
MKNEIVKLDTIGYRNFGLVTGAIFIVIFGMFLPWVFSFNFPIWPWILAGVLAALALIIPKGLEPIYIVWMKLGNVLNWINTRLILGIMFYIIFVPVGTLLMLIGKVPISKKFNNELGTYRKQCEQKDKENMEHPY